MGASLIDRLRETGVNNPLPWEVARESADYIASIEAKLAVAREALSGMLTHMGMDEDEWNKPTFDQARAAIAKGEQA